MLAEIRAGLATPVAGIRWLTEVVWDDPVHRPHPRALGHGHDSRGERARRTCSLEDDPLKVPTRPVGSIWDALDETMGLPILSRAALWRRDAVNDSAAGRAQCVERRASA